MELLLPLVGLIVAVVVFAFRAARARRRRARVLEGRIARCRALVAFGDERFRRGRLSLGRDQVLWRPFRGGTVDLTGASVASAVVEPRHRRARPDDVLVRLLLPTAAEARVLLQEDEGATLARLLRGSEPTAAGPVVRELAVPSPRADESAAGYLGRLASLAAEQVPDGGWPTAERGVRARVWSCSREFVAPVFALVLVVVLTAPWPYRWYVLHTAATATATAVSTGEEVISGPGPVPSDITVKFRDEQGVERGADVATRADLPAGARVPVVYATRKPGWARLDTTADGLPAGAAIGLLGGVSAVGWAIRRLSGLLAEARAISRSARLTPRPAFGLVTADPFGDPLLLLGDPLITPVQLIAVPLALPLPPTASAIGSGGLLSLEVRGPLQAGQAVLASIGGRTLRPSGPACPLDADDLQLILDSAASLAELAD